VQLKDVTLAVRDLNRSVQFYEQAIGLALLTSNGGTARLGVEGAALLHLIERPDAAPRGDAAGLFHVAWLLADRAHLGAALARLDAEGVRLTGAADHHVSEAVYLDDPDGHGIELYADRPAAGWRMGGRLVMNNSRLDLADLRDAATSAGIAPEASGQGMLLGHLHLEAVDLDRASRFAEERLGLELQLGWPNARFLAWDGYHHHLAYNDWNRRQSHLDPAAERIGLVEIGLVSDRAERLTDPSGIVFAIAAEEATRAPQL
jgi:catechol 2,3-dioxygenase